MTTVEIIMQQRKIAAEKENAERKLVYETIKQWMEKNVDVMARDLLKRIANRFSIQSVEKVVYHCSCGMTRFPLGQDFPSEIGLDWLVTYHKNGTDTFRVTFIDNFFSSTPLERNKFSEDTFHLFESQFLFHTQLPKLLREEGFVVTHTGCGCCEEITIKLPI